MIIWYASKVLRHRSNWCDMDELEPIKNAEPFWLNEKNISGCSDRYEERFRTGPLAVTVLLFFGNVCYSGRVAVVGNMDASGRIRARTSSIWILSVRGRHGDADGRHRSAVTGGCGYRNGSTGVATIVLGWDLILVPATVVFQGVENVLAVRVDKVGPGLPQRVDDVVDESNLNETSREITGIIQT